eukprot:scaffold287355_cov33-Tisochrysis_lutea.AAC.3
MYKRLGFRGRGGTLGGGLDGGWGGHDGPGQPRKSKADDLHWYPLPAVSVYSHNLQPAVQSAG